MLLDLETNWGLPTPTPSRVYAEMIEQYWGIKMNQDEMKIFG